MLTNFFYDPSGIYLSGFLLHQKGSKKPQSILVFSSRGWNTLPGACSDLDTGVALLYLNQTISMKPNYNFQFSFIDNACINCYQIMLKHLFYCRDEHNAIYIHRPKQTLCFAHCSLSNFQSIMFTDTFSRLLCLGPQK